jgi:transcriptional regulator of acetoin/glycerol metabolism
MNLRTHLQALTSAILRNEISVETARNLVIEANTLRREIQEALDSTFTNEQAASKLGMSRATFYRQKAKSLARTKAAGGVH